MTDTLDQKQPSKKLGSHRDDCVYQHLQQAIEDYLKNIRVKSSFLTNLFAFPTSQSFFSASYLFLSYGLHACRLVKPRIPLGRNTTRCPLIFRRYISD